MILKTSQNDRRNVYSPAMLTGTQEARPLRNKERSGDETPNPALLGEPRSMKQLELDDYQSTGGRPWRDEGLLRDLYIEREFSTHKIADCLDCSQSTVRDWMKKFGISTRGRAEAQRGISTALRTTERGYEVWNPVTGGKQYTIHAHRLLAVSEFGFKTVKGMEVHHQNGIPWDNRPSNIELMGKSEHGKRHNPTKLGWFEVMRIRELYRNGEVSQQTLGRIFGCSKHPIGDVVNGEGGYGVMSDER